MGRSSREHLLEAHVVKRGLQGRAFKNVNDSYSREEEPPIPECIKASLSLLSAALLACSIACSSGNPGGTAGYTKIDDMEGGANLIEWMPPPGMTPGFWWAATGCSAIGEISPPPWFAEPDGWSFSALPTSMETFPGIISTHAARLRTTPQLIGVWGANMGLEFGQVPPGDGGPVWPPIARDAATSVPDGGGAILDASPPDADGAAVGLCPNPSELAFSVGSVDLSAYSGLTFWAMAAQGGEQTIRVQLNDRDTDPWGGICNPDQSSPDACYNGFGASISLTSTFKRYTIDFSSLQQTATWGYRPTPDLLDLHHVYNLIFEIDLPSCASSTTSMCAGGTPAVSFDFWIDDIYLVNNR
jgi:hypothetical protein